MKQPRRPALLLGLAATLAALTGVLLIGCQATNTRQDALAAHHQRLAAPLIARADALLDRLEAELRQSYVPFESSGIPGRDAYTEAATARLEALIADEREAVYGISWGRFIPRSFETVADLQMLDPALVRVWSEVLPHPLEGPDFEHSYAVADDGGTTWIGAQALRQISVAGESLGLSVSLLLPAAD